MEQRDPQVALADQFVVDAPVAGLPWRLMVFSIVLFVFTLFVYAGIKFGYASYLNTREQNLKQETTNLAKKINPDDQAKYVNFYSQTLNLKKVLDRHVFSTNVFQFLQEKTSVDVYFTNLAYSVSEGSVRIEGVSSNSEALVQQLSIFDNAPEVKSSVLTQMRFNEAGKTSFEILLTFKESFFKAVAQ